MRTRPIQLRGFITHLAARQAVDAAEAEMAEAFLRGEVIGRPPSAPASAEPGRHIVPFAEVCAGTPLHAHI